MIAIAISVCFYTSCILIAIYYLWICVIMLLPSAVVPSSEFRHGPDAVQFYLLIPCLNEGPLIKTTIDRLLELDIPNLNIVVVDDGSTDTTSEVLNTIHRPELTVLKRVYPDARQGKGQALNHGIRHIYRSVKDPFASIVGVLDADTTITAELLQKVAAIMEQAPETVMVQTRIRIRNARACVLTLLQDIEFHACINQMQNLREYTSTVAAAGNGQFMRLSAIGLLGASPWSSCLLEDFDFSLRLLLKGCRTRLLQEESTVQQGVTSLHRLVRQRSRWAQGCIQCLHYTKTILRSSSLSIIARLELLFFLMLPWMNLVSILTMLVSWLLILYSYLSGTTDLFHRFATSTAESLSAVLVIILFLVFMPGILFSISYSRDTRASLLDCLLAGSLVPVYSLLQAPAILLAFYREARGLRGWLKTEHE